MSLKQLQTVLDKLPQPGFIASPSLDLVAINAPLRARSVSSAPTTRLLDLCDPGDRSRVTLALERASAQEDRDGFELRARQWPEADSGSWTLSLLDDGEETWILGLADVCGRDEGWRREVERRQTTRALKEAWRSVDQRFSATAHGINNPTHYMQLSLRLLLDIWRDARPLLDEHAARNPELTFANLPYDEVRDEARLMLEEVVEGTDRIAAYVEEFRVVIRAIAPRVRGAVDFVALLDRARELLAEPLSRWTEGVSVAGTRGLPRLEGDAEDLELAVINLLLELGHAAQGGERRPLKISLRLSSATLEVVFEPIDGRFRLPAEDKGEDLPLSPRGALEVSSRIIAEHDGRLEIRGNGLWVTLPLGDADLNEET